MFKAARLLRLDKPINYLVHHTLLTNERIFIYDKVSANVMISFQKMGESGQKVFLNPTPRNALSVRSSVGWSRFLNPSKCTRTPSVWVRFTENFRFFGKFSNFLIF